MRDVRAECRKALLYALLVADVGEELAYVAESRALARGYGEAEPAEVYADAGRFERDCLAACIRPRYDEDAEFTAAFDVYRHGLLAKQRMARADEGELRAL